MAFKSLEPDATAAEQDAGVRTWEVGELDLALPFPLFNDYAWMVNLKI